MSVLYNVVAPKLCDTPISLTFDGVEMPWVAGGGFTCLRLGEGLAANCTLEEVRVAIILAQRALQMGPHLGLHRIWRSVRSNSKIPPTTLKNEINVFSWVFNEKQMIFNEKVPKTMDLHYFGKHFPMLFF